MNIRFYDNVRLATIFLSLFLTCRLEGKELMKVMSPDFEDNTFLDVKFTLYGDNLPPALIWQGVPESAKSLVLIIDDPDAPMTRPFVHGLFYGIDPKKGELKSDDYKHISSGMTDYKKPGYQGPRPPEDGKNHHYRFQLFALDLFLDVHQGIERQDLEDAMKGHVIAQSLLTGLFRHL